MTNREKRRCFTSSSFDMQSPNLLTPFLGSFTKMCPFLFLVALGVRVRTPRPRRSRWSFKFSMFSFYLSILFSCRGAGQTKRFRPLLDVFRASQNANRWRIINQMFATATRCLGKKISLSGAFLLSLAGATSAYLVSGFSLVLIAKPLSRYFPAQWPVQCKHCKPAGLASAVE